MIRWLHLSACATLFAALVLIAGPGCNPPPKKAPDTAKDKGKEKDKDAKDKKDDHDHGEVGPHGGAIAEWGSSYHGEMVIDHANKQATVYVLDDKAAKAPSVDAKRFSKVKLTLTEEKPPMTIDFALDEKKTGKDTIAFSATHDFFAKKSAFKGVLSARLDDSDPKKVTPLNDNTFEYDPKKLEEKKK